MLYLLRSVRFSLLLQPQLSLCATFSEFEGPSIILRVDNRFSLGVYALHSHSEWRRTENEMKLREPKWNGTACHGFIYLDRDIQHILWPGHKRVSSIRPVVHSSIRTSSGSSMEAPKYIGKLMTRMLFLKRTWKDGFALQNVVQLTVVQLSAFRVSEKICLRSEYVMA